MSSCVPAFICSVTTEVDCRISKSSCQLKMNVTEKKIDNFFTTFEEKQFSEFEKLLKGMDKLHEANRIEMNKDHSKRMMKFESAHEANRSEIMKRMKISGAAMRKFRRGLERMYESGVPVNEEGANDDQEKFQPHEIESPIQFMQDFVRTTDRVDFVNHFLEAKFGNQYRGNRYHTYWKKGPGGKYVHCEFNEIYEWLSVLEHQWQLCKTNPLDYLPDGHITDLKCEYLQRIDEIQTEDGLKLDRTTLKKFLILKHKDLPPLRK